MDVTLPSEHLRIRVTGRVQGVGFRPFVYGLAQTHGVAGWVRNDPEGVFIDIEGPGARAFLEDLPRLAPPLARLRDVDVECRALAHGSGFRIAETGAGPGVSAQIPPDVAVCDDCLEEIFTPGNRRAGHAFVTCTNCGPRFTITRTLPYDRAQTSMAAFEMCPDCAAEYRHAQDRRHHAEPIACPACGPKLERTPEEILARLASGEILALKGLGGFHLAVDARNAAAVARLRQRKGRAGKPLAVMVANLASARALAHVDAREAELLSDPARPIVVLRDRGLLPDAVSEGLPSLGMMLPYTPLHWLIFHAAAGCPAGHDWRERAQSLVLVMTSANPSGEPLVMTEAQAEDRLGGIVDAVAGHDRAIVTRCDDSVARVVGDGPVFLRRGRGYVPDPIALAEDGPLVLALGALLKCAPCLTRGREAVPGQHVGDLTSAATVRFLREAAEHLMDLLRVAPAAVACDLHPDYPSSQLAARFGLPVIPVQHHHAHLAAVAAEAGLTGPLTGLVLDGFGLGPDGTLWGGELLEVEGTRCTRLGHLAPLGLPGGDRAAAEPWRMAAAVLHGLGRGSQIATRFPDRPGAQVAAMLERGMNCPKTTSAGRLFDAAAGLLGLRCENRFEGEAAMALEGLCRAPRELAGGWVLSERGLDLSPLLAVLADTDDPGLGADLFHGTLAHGLAALVADRAPGASSIALTGGCAVNRPLAETLAALLAARGVALVLPRQAPPGDGGLALGQALVARRQLMELA